MCDWQRPDNPSKCMYKPGMDFDISPHNHISLKPRPAICDNILDVVGNTPLIRCNNIQKSEGLECEILAKCEFFNPGGSVKDRISVRMVKEAELEGKLKPGHMIIEPTSGNTGIGLALASAVKGYKCVIVLPEKMSQEKINVLKALGAETVRTRTSAIFDEEDSHIRIADRIQKDTKNADRHILNQYTNANNPLAHFDFTAEEILQACGDKPPDMIVVGAGTGGTICGIARKFKHRAPSCKVVGVDPYGSILAQPSSLNETTIQGYDMEGIGYDFIPTIFDREEVDYWVKVRDYETLNMSRRLIREEGFLCGGSSGAAMWAAIQAIRHFQMGKGKRVVVLLPDSLRNYMSKFLKDDWMIARGNMDFPETPLIKKATSTDLKLSKLSDHGLSKCISPTTKVSEILQMTKNIPTLSNGFALVTEDGLRHEKCVVVGVLDLSLVTKKLLRNEVKLEDSVDKAMNKEFISVPSTESEEKVARTLMNEPYCVVNSASGPVLVDHTCLLKTMEL